VYEISCRRCLTAYSRERIVRKQGLLLINLGSPAGPTERDVRRYLREFLMDGRVIDIPHLVRWFLVNCSIVPGRAAESTHAYRSIWSAKGSPLIVTGRALAEKLEASLASPLRSPCDTGAPASASPSAAFTAPASGS
jgi:ferrochelatase